MSIGSLNCRISSVESDELTVVKVEYVGLPSLAGTDDSGLTTDGPIYVVVDRAALYAVDYS